MKGANWLCLITLLCASPAAWAGGWIGRSELERTNDRLHGQIVDYTRNHGADRRLWSPALGEKRDLYVYLPPGFDPHKQYPLMVWLHGFAQDELSFLRLVGPAFDWLIAHGKLPPMIIAAPDGSFTGRVWLVSTGTFFLNTRAGNFEDYVMQDVLGFLTSHYPIRPEPEAHVLGGLSMGGGAAFNLGIKYRHCFRTVFGIYPPLNSRWIDCHGNYFGNFDPNCWDYRTDFSRGRAAIGRFYGIITIRLGQALYPLYDRRDPDLLEKISRENPIEMIDRYGLQPGELNMYVGYGAKDEFNLDAQIESFLYVAGQRGLEVGVERRPHGRHDLRTAYRLAPGLADWLRPLVAPYSP